MFTGIFYVNLTSNSIICSSPAASHLGMFVEVHAGFGGDVFGADDLTVSLKGL